MTKYKISISTFLMLTLLTACGVSHDQNRSSTVSDIVTPGTQNFVINDWGGNNLGGTSQAIIDPSFLAMMRVLTINDHICFDEATSGTAGNGFILYHCRNRFGNLVWGPQALFLKRGAIVGNAGDFYLMTPNGVSVGVVHSYLGMQSTTFYSLVALCTGPVSNACDLSYQTATRIFQLVVRQ